MSNLIEHVVLGRENEKKIIMLHGFMGCTSSFMGAAQILKQQFCVILVSMYGFGLTPHPNYPLTLDDYAKSILDLINFYHIDEITVAGHSFGGRVAMRLTVLSNKIVRLVLVDSAGLKPKRSLKYYFKVLHYKYCKHFNKKKAATMGSKDYLRLKGAIRKTFINVVNESQKNDARAITIPTLIIWGEKDKETPLYMAKILRKLIVNSELIVFNGCGHFAYVEEQQRFCRIIQAFMLY